MTLPETMKAMRLTLLVIEHALALSDNLHGLINVLIPVNWRLVVHLGLDNIMLVAFKISSDPASVMIYRWFPRGALHLVQEIDIVLSIFCQRRNRTAFHYSFMGAYDVLARVLDDPQPNTISPSRF